MADYSILCAAYTTQTQTQTQAAALAHRLTRIWRHNRLLSSTTVSTRGRGRGRGLALCQAIRIGNSNDNGRQVHRVQIEHEGRKHVLDVGEDETILTRALQAGIHVPHDCKLGVCMTCPARLLSGQVDQSEGMLSDDVVERGYALMCASYPRSDCSIRTIPEDELLSLQLATAND